MKKLIKTIQRLNDALPIMIIQLANSTRIIGLCDEKKKVIHVYSPMYIALGVTEQGQELVKLLPFAPVMMVDTSNTIIRKKDCLLFLPSDSFKAHYLSRLTGKGERKQGKSEKKEKG